MKRNDFRGYSESKVEGGMKDVNIGAVACV